MKSLFILLLVLALTSPAFSGNHTARAKLKADPAIAAKGLSDEELDALIDREKALALRKEARDRALEVSKRLKEMLENDPQLKAGLKKE